MEENKKETSKEEEKVLSSIEKLLDECICNVRERNDVISQRDDFSNTKLADLDPIITRVDAIMTRLDKQLDDTTHAVTNSMLNLLINLADKVIELEEDIEKLKSTKCKCHDKTSSISDSDKEGVETNE